MMMALMLKQRTMNMRMMKFPMLGLLICIPAEFAVEEVFGFEAMFGFAAFVASRIFRNRFAFDHYAR